MTRANRRWRLVAATLGAVLTAGACVYDWDDYEPHLGAPVGGAGGTVSSGGGEGGTVVTGGSGGVAGGGGAVGGGASGGGGGITAVLVDRGLLVRYYLDEAASGTAPSEVQDAASNPLALALDYGIGAGGGGTNMVFVQASGHRGLRWFNLLGSGSAGVDLLNTKLTSMDGQTEATIECVAEVDVAGGNCSRMFQFGVNSYGTLTLCAAGQTLAFRLNGTEREEWSIDHVTLGRIVAHAVLDTSLDDADRVRLFVDGVDQGVGSLVNNPPAVGTAINLSGGELHLGNREQANRSFEGMIFYCALYTVALDDAEVAHNAALLKSNDDTP